jgi:hypothetical protein
MEDSADLWVNVIEDTGKPIGCHGFISLLLNVKRDELFPSTLRFTLYSVSAAVPGFSLVCLSVQSVGLLR